MDLFQKKTFWKWAFAAGVLLLGALAFKQFFRSKSPAPEIRLAAGPGDIPAPRPVRPPSKRPGDDSPPLGIVSTPDPHAAETVARKVGRFVRKRRDVVHAMAKKFNVAVPPEMERFFDAAEAGRWEESEKIFAALKQLKQTDQPGSRELSVLFPAVSETLGVAQEARDWPAQKLLDYGNSILGALRPGMVYFGGTDAGRFIPTLLNETSEGERHVVLTQNALADNAYLDYVGFLYGGQFAPLQNEDSGKAFQSYISDVAKRHEHDRKFPGEPPLIRPGEEVEITEGKVQVSGQVAVMAINEKLVDALMQRNPGASFAMEESFPFASSSGRTSLLGPILELQAEGAREGLSSEGAAQSVEYWRATAETLGTAALDEESQEHRKAYAKMASAQARLMNEQGYPDSALEAFAIAVRMGPGSPEAVYGYANLLVRQNRIQEAIPVVQKAVAADPNQGGFATLLDHLKTMRQP